MDLALSLELVLLVVGVIGIAYAWMGKGVKHRTPIAVVGAVLGLYGLAVIAGVMLPFSFGGDSMAAGAAVAGGKQLSINTFKVLAKESISNSYTAVSGTLKVFDENVNPSDANANPLASIVVAAGTASNTTANVRCGVVYRWVFDGTDGTYYDVDLGKKAVDCNELGTDGTNSVYQLDLNDVLKIATISDICAETTGSTSTACLGHQSSVNTSVAPIELYANTPTTDDTGFNYNETEGDGSFDVYLTLGSTGAQTGLKNPVLCFKDASTNAPAGNEFSAITHTHESGSQMFSEQALLNYWKNQECLSLGAQLNSGVSGIEKLTFDITEANADANMDFEISFDDLGSIGGKDVLLNSGATKESLNFLGTSA